MRDFQTGEIIEYTTDAGNNYICEVQKFSSPMITVTWLEYFDTNRWVIMDIQQTGSFNIERVSNLVSHGIIQNNPDDDPK